MKKKAARNRGGKTPRKKSSARPTAPAAEVRSVREPATAYAPSETAFRPLKSDVIRADARGRVTVGSEISEKQFRVMVNDEGQILLDPVVVIPAREAWLLENPRASASVLRGIEQSKAGKTRSLGSFVEFAALGEDD
jgi:hypothetical protein